MSEVDVRRSDDRAVFGVVGLLKRAVTRADDDVPRLWGWCGALSTLRWDGQGCSDVLSSWHEYVAFLLAVQGIFTGLAMLVWLLVASTPDAADTGAKSG